MANATIVVDDSEKNFAFDGAVDSLKDSGIEISVESLSNFIRRHSIRFVEGRPEYSEREETIANGSSSHLILDRVISISDRTIAELRSSDAMLFRGQVSAVYERLLNSYRAPLPPKMSYTTVGKLLPLPSQWLLVNRELPQIATPEYVHGYGPEIISTAHLKNPVFKSPFDLYSWVSNESKEDGSDMIDRFAVDIPEGVPVLSYVLGEITVTSPLRKDFELEMEMSLNLSEGALSIARLFGTSIGEILWYVSGSQIVFATFSHSLFAAKLQPQFNRHAVQFLEQFFQIRYSDLH